MLQETICEDATIPFQTFRFTERADRAIAPPARPLRRIVFTGDHLRTERGVRSSATMETRWLANLLGYQVSLACPDAGIEVHTWDQAGPFCGDTFYALNGMTPCFQDWVRLVDARELTGEAAEYLARSLEGALVIGNNLTNFQLRFLNEIGTPYLDFIIHPARFLDDIIFGIRTNSPEMLHVLQDNAYPEEMIRLQAAIHQAGLLRPAPAPIPEGSGLFAAQHGIDKALVADGQFQNIEDYREGIAAFLERHPCVYVKPHPHARQTASVIALLRALAGDPERIRVIQDNIYSLIVNPNVSEVCGISSCAVYEADYFGKPVTYLSKARPLLYGAFDRDLDPFKYVSVYDAFFNPAFWSRILASVCDVRVCPDLELPRKTSRLRNSLQVYWGYGYLDWEVQLRTIGMYPPAAPSPPPSWQSHAEGLRHFQEGQFEEAVECFAMAVVEDPTAERWNDWAVAQLSQGRTQTAIDGFRLATRLDPTDRQASANLQALLAG
jgi:tetratricopeptide (TPR) repeat protein